MMRNLMIVLGVVAAICGCSSIDCPVQNTVRTYYQVQSSNNKVDTLRDTLTVRSVRADGKDTLLLNNTTQKTIFSLPIGYTSAEDVLVFNFKNKTFAAVDTVWVRKENSPHFESVDCSATYFHHLTSIRSTHNAIDSININNPTVDYDPQTVHFHLYLKSHN